MTAVPVVTGDGTSAAAGVNAWWIFEDAAGTGMATEAYSVIEQGKVDVLLVLGGGR